MSSCFTMLLNHISFCKLNVLVIGHNTGSGSKTERFVKTLKISGIIIYLTFEQNVIYNSGN